MHCINIFMMYMATNYTNIILHFRNSCMKTSLICLYCKYRLMQLIFFTFKMLLKIFIKDLEEKYNTNILNSSDRVMKCKQLIFYGGKFLEVFPMLSGQPKRQTRSRKHRKKGWESCSFYFTGTIEAEDILSFKYYPHF